MEDLYREFRPLVVEALAEVQAGGGLKPRAWWKTLLLPVAGKRSWMYHGLRKFWLTRRGYLRPITNLIASVASAVGLRRGKP